VIPDSDEFSAARGLSEGILDSLFSDSKLERKERYNGKIKLIRENPLEALKVFTDEKRERYDSFLEKTVDSANNLDKLDSGFDWREIVRQDYENYEPKVDFDNPSDSDLIIIFFHESLYEKRNKYVVSRMEKSEKELEYGETWRPLYTIVDVGSSKVPFKIADVRHYINPSSIENFARNLPGTMDEEEAWDKICEYAKNTIGFEINFYRKVENTSDCRKRIQEIFPIDLESVGSILRKYVASSEF